MFLPESYSRIDNFKHQVIYISVDQIDAKETVPKVVKRPSLTRAYVEKHALPGESWEVARERLRAERAKA